MALENFDRVADRYASSASRLVRDTAARGAVVVVTGGREGDGYTVLPFEPGSLEALKDLLIRALGDVDQKLRERRQAEDLARFRVE